MNQINSFPHAYSKRYPRVAACPICGKEIPRCAFKAHVRKCRKESSRRANA